jgi:hypothetical protein
MRIESLENGHVHCEDVSWDHQGSIGNTLGNVLAGPQKPKQRKIKPTSWKWRGPGRISP